MSLSSSFPHGAPTLAEVLLQRTFAKPPEPFVDGELTDALERAGGVGIPPEAVQPPAGTGGSGTSSDGASDGSSTGPQPGKAVDVRV